MDLAALCAEAPSASDVVKPEGLPDIGKWMIGPEGNIADRLGWRYFGKGLLEPIGIIIFDPIAKSADEAYSRLESAAIAVESEMRSGHSTGYDGIIDGVSFEQLPTGKGRAISDGPSEFANNHGRIFGPLPWNGGWILTAAFSREVTELVTKVKHRFASSNQARDGRPRRTRGLTRGLRVAGAGVRVARPVRPPLDHHILTMDFDLRLDEPAIEERRWRTWRVEKASAAGQDPGRQRYDDLVNEPCCHEAGQDPRAALDHEARDPSLGEGRKDCFQFEAPRPAVHFDHDGTCRFERAP